MARKQKKLEVFVAHNYMNELYVEVIDKTSPVYTGMAECHISLMIDKSSLLYWHDDES